MMEATAVGTAPVTVAPPAYNSAAPHAASGPTTAAANGGAIWGKVNLWTLGLCHLLFEKFGDLSNGSFGKRLLGSKYLGGGGSLKLSALITPNYAKKAARCRKYQRAHCWMGKSWRIGKWIHKNTEWQNKKR
jgi:hypothetical protein